MSILLTIFRTLFLGVAWLLMNSACSALELFSRLSWTKAQAPLADL